MEELKKWLVENGFGISENVVADTYNQEKWYAYKRSSLAARRCECNSDKEGVQIVIYPWKMIFDGKKSSSVEVEICGEASGTWWKLRSYGINSKELPGKFADIEKSLVSAWNALI